MSALPAPAAPPERAAAGGLDGLLQRGAGHGATVTGPALSLPGAVHGGVP